MYFKKIFLSLAVFYCSLPMVSHADQVNPYQAHHLEDTEKILIQFFIVRDSNCYRLFSDRIGSRIKGVLI